MAAMDTTSNALAMTLQLLSEHTDVQEKLRKEIFTAHEAGDIGYDLVMSLPYLDAVCRETLRLYIPSDFVRSVRNLSQFCLQAPSDQPKLQRVSHYLAVCTLALNSQQDPRRDRATSFAADQGCRWLVHKPGSRPEGHHGHPWQPIVEH